MFYIPAEWLLFVWTGDGAEMILSRSGYALKFFTVPSAYNVKKCSAMKTYGW